MAREADGDDGDNGIRIFVMIAAAAKIGVLCAILLCLQADGGEKERETSTFKTISNTPNATKNNKPKSTHRQV